MGSRRFALAALAAVLLTGGSVGTTTAKKPDPGTGGGTAGEQPLTAAQQAASDRKAADAERFTASLEAANPDLVPLGCVVPTGGAEAMTADEQSSDAGAGPDVTATAQLTPMACSTPQGFISLEARDQIRGHYCGPAVGQVIANYSWAMPRGVNKYTQGLIAGWMSTDVLGQTTATTLEVGLERATAGSPRRPANWNWVVTALTDTDRDGLTGDQLHAYVKANVSGSRMPLAIPVKPHDDDSPTGSHLASWPNPVNSVGHWVAIYGWVGNYDGTDRSRMYYTDSSRDEGGATGWFWTPTRRFAFLIREHTGRLVW